MKKAAALLFAVMVFAGCASTKSAPADTAAETETVAETVEAVEEAPVETVQE